MANKNRPLYILKYLWDNTDEDHPAIINDILSHLENIGIHTNRKTVASDLLDLQDSGFDVVSIKSRQNKYFIGSRSLELAELKMIVDAVQAAKFISQSKSIALIERISALGSPFHADQLKRHLYVEGKPKTTNETVYYTVDLIHSLIQQKKTIRFQYIEYSPTKEKTLKHNGYLYILSPYDLVWNNECYYVLGWSERHQKVAKFRVDRMYKPAESKMKFHARPTEYNIEDYCDQVFLMFDGDRTLVELLCDNSLMKTIVDQFGEDVKTRIVDKNRFVAEVEVSASPTFFSWVFAYGGKMQILSPLHIKEQYQRRLAAAME